MSKQELPTYKIAKTGFSVKLTIASELGLAMLIADMSDGSYRPVCVTSSIREALYLAGCDMNQKRSKQAAYPTSYEVWARGQNGDQHIACEITAN